jgi:hypothetical protein
MPWSVNLRSHALPRELSQKTLRFAKGVGSRSPRCCMKRKTAFRNSGQLLRSCRVTLGSTGAGGQTGSLEMKTEREFGRRVAAAACQRAAIDSSQ